MNSKTIAVDFDGVIHNNSEGYKDGEIYGEVMPDAKKMLQLMTDHGYTVVIHTTRDEKEKVAEWMIKNKIPYHSITNIKPIAKFYIDDRAIRFTNWQDVIRYVL